MYSGIPYVEEAKTFSGFKPMDEHIELKLSGQLLMIDDLAAAKIAKNYKTFVEKRQVKRMMEIVERDKKIRIIQDYMRRYMMRLRYVNHVILICRLSFTELSSLELSIDFIICGEIVFTKSGSSFWCLFNNEKALSHLINIFYSVLSFFNGFGGEFLDEEKQTKQGISGTGRWLWCLM